jgi:hypothetical protein
VKTTSARPSHLLLGAIKSREPQTKTPPRAGALHQLREKDPSRLAIDNPLTQPDDSVARGALTFIALDTI